MSEKRPGCSRQEVSKGGHSSHRMESAMARREFASSSHDILYTYIYTTNSKPRYSSSGRKNYENCGLDLYLIFYYIYYLLLGKKSPPLKNNNKLWLVINKI